ncbi:SDR family NAD(P)-dependent oxidoreductase [Halobacteriovorax sp. JY17]|uniref:SDR family NAD(P)-dependent oxidoreductase n=1 Tax=Halobacteriovorax sp. JY17 TaxID=2014617 RepID=UPI000C379898|nr:SDR family NAD(P)-dependent oxidoreductase [Halobacteriovorax sp. JY17]PIK16435.1 MAG: 3-oxoacyl-ACP reductase [Halobacteriovorax sp. JY17]
MKIFITGGTTGIGWSLAKEYLEDDHIVGICGRDLSRIETGALEKFKNLKTYKVDVTNREELIAAVDEFSEGSLDLMIASAGRSVGSKTKEPDFVASRDVININVLGVLNTFEAALKNMLPNKKGHLAAVASVAGMVGLPGASSYSASKAAVLKLCESYSMDLKSFNIDVTCIAPGFVDTPLTQKNDHGMPWLMSSEKAAKKIRKALDRKKVLFVFPWQMKTVMFILERLPRWMYRAFMQMPIANYSK